jgi:hypothetical protein
MLLFTAAPLFEFIEYCIDFAAPVATTPDLMPFTSPA